MPPSKQCIARLQRELKSLQKAQDASFTAAPDTRDILTWLFVFDGPVDTPYAGGRYMGKIVFPPDYPFKPPDVHILTPNGRFKVNVPICMTNSAFHPESWSPIWTAGTIITGFISFFVSDESTSSALVSSRAHRQELARQSRSFNVTHLGKLYEQTLPEAYARDRQGLPDLTDSRELASNTNRSTGLRSEEAIEAAAPAGGSANSCTSARSGASARRLALALLVAVVLGLVALAVS